MFNHSTPVLHRSIFISLESYWAILFFSQLYYAHHLFGLCFICFIFCLWCVGNTFCRLSLLHEQNIPESICNAKKKLKRKVNRNTSHLLNPYIGMCPIKHKRKTTFSTNFCSSWEQWKKQKEKKRRSKNIGYFDSSFLPIISIQ